MGNSSPASELYIKINKLINSSRFNESFLLLKKNILLFPELLPQLEFLKEQELTYQYMLDYISEGHFDPSQELVIDKIKGVLLRSNDLLLRHSKLKDSSDIYSSTRRMFSLRETDLIYLFDKFKEAWEEDRKLHNDDSLSPISPLQAKTISDLFNYIWTSSSLKSEETLLINNIFENSDYPDYLKAELLSAITLGNISYFNPETFEILLDALENPNSPLLKARAIMGIVLIAIRFPNRINLNLDLKSRLILLSGDSEFTNYFNETLIGIIRTYDTKRIDRKMRDEVIPGLMKIKPDIIDKMKDISSDSESFLSDENPAWEELIENSDIGKQLREINDMQMEGADVMVTAFSNLKSFPFFNTISNWFLPFYPSHHEFSSFPLEHDKETIDRLTTGMCDSDLYSFLLSLSSMQDQRKNQILENIQNQMKEAREIMGNSIGETEKQEVSRKIRQSLQDIYRFFNFYRKKEDFNNPFENPILSSDIESLIPVLGIAVDNLKLIAEFYFKNKYYSEAAGFYEMIDGLEPGNFNYWEKIGFCYDHMHRYDKAVDWYMKAEMVNPGNTWIEKKLAIALKNAGRTEESLEFYKKALLNDPENYHLLMSAGQAFLSSERYKEALQHFYHAQYLKPEKKDTLRAVTWAELLSGNHEKAKLLFENLITEKEVDKTDYLNAAHAALARGEFKVALNLYKKFIDKTDNKDITELVMAFRDDSDVIKKLGIKTSDLRLIIDKIRYDLMK